jgi:hypothetical protein
MPLDQVFMEEQISYLPIPACITTTDEVTEQVINFYSDCFTPRQRSGGVVSMGPTNDYVHGGSCLLICVNVTVYRDWISVVVTSG